MPEEKGNGEQPSSRVAQIVGAARSNRSDNLRAKAELVRARAEAKAMKIKARRGDSESTTTPQVERGERREPTSAEMNRAARQLASGSESEKGTAQKQIRRAPTYAEFERDQKVMQGRSDTPLATSPDAGERKDISEFLRKRVGFKK